MLSFLLASHLAGNLNRSCLPVRCNDNATLFLYFFHKIEHTLWLDKPLTTLRHG